MLHALKNLFLINLLLLSTALFAQSQNQPIAFGTSAVLSSSILNENRTINIYIPEEYNENSDTKYPVIYILDGGVEEDFFHLAGIVRFNTQSWINRFPKSIVVGIENTNRRRDFTFAVSNTDFIEKEGFKKSSFPQYGESQKYIDFLEKELQPYLEKNYRVNEQKTIIGESLAGLLATEILLKRPHLFQNYIIISPSLWWGEQALLKNAKTLLNQNLKKPVRVYIGAPSKEEDLKMYQEVETLYKTVKTDKNAAVIFDYMPDETHATVIHQAVYNAFKKWAKK
ncbi:alpha/beta hydrolase [Flavobacterium cerinum]|uniref:Alpha/beta hydrolase-fold protein n=1 Tax=Flavobacterium cerinum TaxID=2502784 RepID=A0ABY5IUF6_9FLAO|nr:alpha/beta hydrolase-fold protein [Flavobacterium cerinum]UUC45802.1 alpha/beta hydrolase-fold protein [Flavobacterium cerinum]